MSFEDSGGDEVTHAFGGDFDADGVFCRVELSVDGQPTFCGGRSDSIDDDFVTGQRSATPVHGSMRKQAVFNSVLFTGSGRQVAHRDYQSGLSGQGGQLRLPRSVPPPSAVMSSQLDSGYRMGLVLVAIRSKGF